MIIIMLFAGLLSTMNTWTYSIKDIRFNLNDLYMVGLMIGWMILFMNIFKMESFSTSYILLTILFIAFVFYAIRSQFLINDSEFLRGMIPHHSMAILMSDRIRSKTKNSKIISLANQIIDSQQQEIVHMNNLLNEINSTNK